MITRMEDPRLLNIEIHPLLVYVNHMFSHKEIVNQRAQWVHIRDAEYQAAIQHAFKDYDC